MICFSSIKGFYEEKKDYEDEIGDEWLEKNGSHEFGLPDTDEEISFPHIAIWHINNSDSYIALISTYAHWQDVFIDDLVSVYCFIERFMPLIQRSEHKEAMKHHDAEFAKMRKKWD